MPSRSWRFVALSVLCLVPAAFPAPFRSVVDIGEHASDVALDERRGVVYVANYTGDEIAEVSTANCLVQRTINVMSQPAGLGLAAAGGGLRSGQPRQCADHARCARARARQRCDHGDRRFAGEQCH